MNRILITLLCACLISPAYSQGPLTPPGAPAPTMKTLDQVEARSPLAGGATAISISQPGSYYLTGNLTVTTGNAITINTSGVTLDLNGFTISSTAASANGSGILLGNSLSDITILHGHIKGAVTYNNTTFSGGGFNNGITGMSGLSNIRVAGISVSGVKQTGIELAYNSAISVESCTVNIAGNTGISAERVSDSVANYGGSYGIVADTVTNCFALSVHDSAITATTVNGSYGYSLGAGSGIRANTVSNSYGRAGSGDGIYAYSVAANCQGISYSGAGVYAVSVATACQGFTSGSDYGVYGFTVSNSHGSSDNGYGLYAFDMAIGSYGVSTSGIGLRAFIANSCDGNTRAITNKYNMP